MAAVSNRFLIYESSKGILGYFPQILSWRGMGVGDGVQRGEFD